MATRAKKQFGQHWLRNERVLDQIMAAAQVQPQEPVLEIGPGQGVLTQRLLAAQAAVLAVEIDRDLCRQLVKKFGAQERFLLLQGDFLTLDLRANLGDFPQFQHPQKVVANIPYNITGPILEKLLGTIAHPRPQPYQSITLLVQKEVADRLTAQPHTKAFGAMTVRVQYLAACRLICPVAPRDFSPPPQVESAVIQLLPRPFSPSVRDPRWLDRLVRLGFSSRRKMLRNNLHSVSDRAGLDPLLADLGLSLEVRAEDLSVAQWVELSNRLAMAAPSSHLVNEPPPEPAPEP